MIGFLGDYCHMAYNVITAYILLQLLEKSQRPVPKFVQVSCMLSLLIIVMVHLNYMYIFVYVCCFPTYINFLSSNSW